MHAWDVGIRQRMHVHVHVHVHVCLHMARGWCVYKLPWGACLRGVYRMEPLLEYFTSHVSFLLGADSLISGLVTEMVPGIASELHDFGSQSLRGSQ